ncbi:hypothetical protein UA08_08216 [Talaromyces atroroseus]|uniref:Rhodopsin domain-containing protein n=1 Tax=Talaromyces atroroseus TaxID=1441469 RepID=A0A225ANU3_TALAT|nr:hypothetical protein UA08_08216 [Talaromyces atroroseus]OKL56626.1 hypothetical protein UA08_08216 [Talaromyces atroroseus]
MSRFTGDTETPAINVLSWFLLVISILGVLTRLGTKLWIFRKFTNDDYMIILSAVFNIFQGVALSIATGHGYGFHMDKLTDAQLTAIMKSQYAQQILTIASLASSKSSFIMFVKSITAVPIDHKIAWGLLISMATWAFVSIITVAFGCQPPRTWDYLDGKCYNMQAWENFFSASNIATELAIIAYTFIIIARIHTRLGRKLGIASVFGLRILVIGAIIAQTVLLNRAFKSSDLTHATWAATIATQTTLCLSILTACSAQFKPFLDSLQSSGMRLDALTTHSHGQSHKFHNYAYHSGSHMGSKIVSINLRGLTSRGKIHAHNSHGPHVQTVVTADPMNSPDWDGASQTSQSRIIRETRTWAVTEERHEDVSEQDDNNA